MSKENTTQDQNDTQEDVQQDTAQDTSRDEDRGDEREDTLGEKGIKALKDERKARKEAEQRLSDALERIQKFEDAQRSDEERRELEVQRLRDQLEEERREREKASLSLLANEVATEFEIPQFASRLRGSTREELEEDAKELKKVLEPKGARKPAPVPQNGRAQGSKRSNGEVFEDFFKANFG